MQLSGILMILEQTLKNMLTDNHDFPQLAVYIRKHKYQKLLVLIGPIELSVYKLVIIANGWEKS